MSDGSRRYNQWAIRHNVLKTSNRAVFRLQNSDRLVVPAPLLTSNIMSIYYIYIYVERTFWVYFVPTFICPHALSTMILGKVPSAMVLLFGLPLHVFVVCCWGGKIVPLRAWSKSSLTLISLLRLSSLSPLVVIWANGFVVVCCCWGGRVVVLCTCLLLPGARSGSGSFQKVGLQCPPSLHFSHFSFLAYLYLFVHGAEARALLPI